MANFWAFVELLRRLPRLRVLVPAFERVPAAYLFRAWWGGRLASFQDASTSQPFPAPIVNRTELAWLAWGEALAKGDSAWKVYPDACLDDAAESSRNLGYEIAEAGRRVMERDGVSPFEVSGVRRG